MHKLESLILMLDHALDTKRKRHIAGGVLFSASLLFGGLAMTIITLKEKHDEQQFLD